MTITISAEETASTADEAFVSAGPEAFRAEIRTDEPQWNAVAVPEIAGRVLHAVAAAGLTGDAPLHADILCTDDASVARLNADFRAKPVPTNVLAFPSGEPLGADGSRHIGGIVLAYGVMHKEAAERGISLARHTTHLALHGLLHLLGFDHEDAAEREAMERQEIEILEGLGVPDPYQGS